MTTTELLVIDQAAESAPPDWRARSWTVVGLILADVLAGIIGALTGHNALFIGALVGLIPAGIALHLALVAVEKAEVR